MGISTMCHIQSNLKLIKIPPQKNNETIKAKMVYYSENKKDKSVDYYIEEENEQ